MKRSAKTGAPAKTKVTEDGRVCTGCNKFKPWSQFGNKGSAAKGRRPRCNKCRKAARKAIQNKDPLKRKAQNVRGNMRQRTELPVPTSLELEAWLKSISPFVCYYTSVPLEVDDFSVDHKQPVNRGGTNDLTNLCVCTKVMNTSKGNMTEQEFKELLALISGWEDGGKRLLARLRMAGNMYR